MKVEAFRKGEYEGAEALEKGDFWNFGKREHLGAGTVFFSVGDIFLVWSLGGLLQGCTRLLGVLGSGARNPHGILELGSRIGSVPSWQGGKIQFWAEFGRSLGRAVARTDEDWRNNIRQRYAFS
jgi:hypothetical protein